MKEKSLRDSKTDSQNFYCIEYICVTFIILLVTQGSAGPALVLIASLDQFSCQTRMVSPVDGSVFLHNFWSAVALEIPRK